MRNDRRVFLAGWLAVASSPLWARAQQQGQYPNGRTPGNSPGSSPGMGGASSPGSLPGTFPGDVPEADPDATPAINPRAILKEDRKNIEHDAATLLQMAEDLKKQVDSLDTTEVLSLDLIHKAEGIEKLAHQIKTLMQGS
ncbi:MAG: hypothetical protein WBF06_01355 [Candidatus Acidiferrales bacterium]